MIFAKERAKSLLLEEKNLYKESLKIASNLHITKVNTTVEDGDTFFPSIDKSEWYLEKSKNFDKDEKHEHSFSINVYKTKNPKNTTKRCNKIRENVKGTIKGNTLICEYNIQDSVLVLRLFEKLNVWISIIELSSIVRVTPMEFFTRGQQVRCIAQLYHAASHKQIVLTQRDQDFIFFTEVKLKIQK